jgi:hypothetical protein
MTKISTVVLACLMASTEAFSPQFQKNTIVSRSNKAFIMPQQPHGVQIGTSTRDISRHLVEGINTDVIFPCLVMVAAAAATIMKSDQNDDVIMASPLPASAPVAEDAAVPVVEEVPVVAEAPVPAPVAVRVPFPAPIVAESMSGKDISKLKMEIASTKEGEEAKGARLAASMKAEEKKPEVAPVVTEVVAAVPKRKSKRSMFLRVLKKIIAPWRKWSNIQ